MNAAMLALAVSFLQFFEARNTIANYVYAPPPEGAEPVKCERPQLVKAQTCPACEGNGFLVLQEPNFGQANGRIGAARKTKAKCPVCKGAGKFESYVSPTELTAQVARDREQFASAHQGKGDIAVGQAFVPNAAYSQLEKDRRRLKLVEEAYGKPCPKCRWTGIEQCRKCHGEGVLKCDEPDCKGGWLVTKTTTERSHTSSGSSMRGSGMHSSGSRRSSTKQTTVNVQVCPKCGGAKMLVCPECGGMKAKPCKSCSGLGVKSKAGGSL